MSNYEVPAGIRSRIPNYFYCAFGGELFAVFGATLVKNAEAHYNFFKGSAGWHYAFKATCTKLDLPWLLDYYISLSWSDMIEFNTHVAQELCCGDKHPSSYYRYLLRNY